MQAVGSGGDQPVARGAEGVADRERPAVDVGLGDVDVAHLARVAQVGQVLLYVGGARERLGLVVSPGRTSSSHRTAGLLCLRFSAASLTLPNLSEASARKLERIWPAKASWI